MANVIIVSNRLPISVKKIDGELKFSASDGGLARGLASYTKDKKNKWVGWPGIVSEQLSEQDKSLIVSKLAKHNCYPVFLTANQVDGYYNNYSNSVLWPLFHQMSITKHYPEKFWHTYKQVNQLFAETVLGLSDPESTIWVHDYQLLLVPEMLRSEHPFELIGLFLHIPFPLASEFTNFQHAKRLIKGMLGSDLIGFHTNVYAQDFIDSCQELKIGKLEDEKILYNDRQVKITDFPLGIDYDKFAQAGESELVKKHQKLHRKKFGKRKKIILTVDRLDPTKGLVQRLLAYQELLHKNKRLRKRVVLVMLAIPTRTDIDAYKKLKQKVEQLVLEINLTFGKRRWQPVHYMYKSVPFEELVALYREADVAFIAPIKDGMNLVAKEYVASRPSKHGVLILSETAGAAEELTDALLVNPKLPASLVDGLTSALSMRPKELTLRLNNMKQQLSSNTIYDWQDKYLRTLRTTNLLSNKRTKKLTSTESTKIIKAFKQAKYPTIMLDYDGVISAFTSKPSSAKPSKSLVSLLQKLSAVTKGGVLIISGRNKQDLNQWLGDIPLTLAAEHGAVMKTVNNKRWHKVVDAPSNWKRLILPVMQKYADKTPGAFVEEKDSSLVWHHRIASPYHAQKNITILRRSLKPFLKLMGLEIYRGNMILEIKSPHANKGVVASKWINDKHDFILAIGDDYTDEDMFDALPESAYTIKVGSGKTGARFRVNSVEEVINLLGKIAK